MRNPVIRITSRILRDEFACVSCRNTECGFSVKREKRTERKRVGLKLEGCSRSGREGRKPGNRDGLQNTNHKRALWPIEGLQRRRASGAAPKSTLSALADGLQAGSKASPSPLYLKKGANSRGLKRHSAQFLLGCFAIDVGAKFLGTLIRPSRGQRRWRAGRWRRRRPRSAILRRRAG